MIEVKQVSHAFEIGKKGLKNIIPVLEDVPFSVKKGEIITIVGRSGFRKVYFGQYNKRFIKPNQGEV